MDCNNRERARTFKCTHAIRMLSNIIIGEFLNLFAVIPLLNEGKVDWSNAIFPDERESKCLSATTTTRY